MVIRSTFKRGKIGQSFKGLAYSYTSKHGEVVASMPSKPGKARSSLQQQNMDLFKQATIAMKLMPAPFLVKSAKDAKGTPMLPRDAILAALYGKGPTIVLPGGRVIRPMANRVDMSSVMDNIAWRPGSMLWRDNELWQGIDPPAVPSLLGFDLVDGPVWLDAENFGSSRIWQNPIPGLIVSSSFNCKGSLYVPHDHIICYGMSSYNEIENGKTVWFSCYEVTVGRVISAIKADEQYPVAMSGGARYLTHQWATPFILSPGNLYVFAVRVPADATTFNTRQNIAPRDQKMLPLVPSYARFALASQNPVVGDQFTSQTTSEQYAIGIQGRV